MQDLVAAGKNGLPCGPAGTGGLPHLASELVNVNADGNVTHLPYQSSRRWCSTTKSDHRCISLFAQLTVALFYNILRPVWRG